MTKLEFVKKVAERAELTQEEAKRFIAAFEDTMLEDVFAAEDSIRLAIGTFSGYTKETPERKARNPRTGEEILVAAKSIKGFPKFKASKAAKE